MKKMIDKFLWWMKERHSIYLRRKAGQPWPWTDDKVLREYKFTNVYRELDAVTLELHKRVDRLKMERADRLYRIILFRAFNWPATYDLVDKWDTYNVYDQMKKVLKKAMNEKQQIFTGAYIVTNAGSTRPKIDVMCDALAEIYNSKHALWGAMENDGTMEGCTKLLAQMPMHGKFTSYEVICDLRYQKNMFRKTPPDVNTWANVGPGARRGMWRIKSGGALERHPSLKTEAQQLAFMRDLHAWISGEWPTDERHWPQLEMREIEHSLCEFDKWLRATRGEGRPRSRYVHA